MLTKYKLGKIIASLKANEGRYRCNGQVCNGARFPEGDLFYQLDDLELQESIHVPVEMVTEANKVYFQI